MTEEQLLALSGMAYAQGKYSAYAWETKTGTLPVVGKYIRIRNGLCYWTPAAEAVVNAHFAQVAYEMARLGIAHRDNLTYIER
jgi:hypothetical protein